jgi:predicted deacetylase
MKAPQHPCLVTIHDVMPSTLPQVEGILLKLEELEVRPVTLLVVPGSGWSDHDLQRLHAFHEAGHEFAGHGGTHRCGPVKTFGHALHSLFISRNVAEHLSLSADEITILIEKCFQWFIDVSLPPSALYVPPAWAMGRISQNALEDLPFTMYEHLTGLWHAGSQTFVRLPLVGYEADTALRVWSLRIFNAFNHEVSTLTKLPLRIAIHPDDLTLGLSSELHTLLARHKQFWSYRQIFHKTP